jgi:pSer/pThr/pTyr-binding forkhead associated (FHA) protein
MSTTCHKCATALNADDAYCSHCGQPVSGRLRATHPQASHSNAPKAPIVQWARPPLTRLPTAITLRLATGKGYALRGQGAFTIGRRAIGFPKLDVDLDKVHGYELGVSRQHLRLYLRPDGVFAEDLVSTSDTVLNGYRLGSSQLYPLRDGDELKLGGIVMNVEFHYD